MENGKSNSWASHLEQLSEFFDVSPDYFVQDDEKNVQNNENLTGSLALQNNGTIKTVNNLSEKLIEQYEACLKDYETRLKEKDEIIASLKEGKKA